VELVATHRLDDRRQSRRTRAASLVVGDTLYFKTFACDLASGKPSRTWQVPAGGCGALSASLHTAFFRAGSAYSTDLASVEHRELTGVTRPGCG
jgi:hypothetical protein